MRKKTMFAVVAVSAFALSTTTFAGDGWTNYGSYGHIQQQDGLLQNKTVVPTNILSTWSDMDHKTQLNAYSGYQGNEGEAMSIAKEVVETTNQMSVKTNGCTGVCGDLNAQVGHNITQLTGSSVQARSFGNGLDTPVIVRVTAGSEGFNSTGSALGAEITLFK